MRKLSNRLTRELIEHGNLPVSAEGLVRLRPDIASELAEAQELLANEIEPETRDLKDKWAEKSDAGFLEARFVAASESAEQCHLFMLEAKGDTGDSNRIKRWSKMPVSYGSLVQVKEYLSDAWGDLLELELERSQFSLNRQA